VSTLDQVLSFFQIDPTGLDNKARRMPIEIPNVGRRHLAQLFAHLEFRLGSEIGVEQGAYAEELLRHNPGLHLLAVDAWQAYRGYREHVSQDKLEGFYASTQQRLAPYHVTYIRKFSVDAAKGIENGSLDFAYIDANHSLQSVIQDIHAWLPKVRSGGIVAGHDYCQRRQSGYQVHVVEAVKAWASAYFVYPWFVLGSKEIVDGRERDRPRSWMWVKP